MDTLQEVLLTLLSASRSNHACLMGMIKEWSILAIAMMDGGDGSYYDDAAR